MPSAPADLACYKAALDACGRAGEVRVCMIVMEAMQAEVKAGNTHLKPDKLCYGAALTACRVKGASRTAIGLLNRMEKIDKLKPDQRCLLATVSACLTGGEASTAAVVLEGIVRKGTRTSQGARDGVREMCQPETGGGLNEEGLERCRAALDKLDALEAERVRKAAARKENLEGGGDGRGSGGSGAGGVVVAAAAAGVKSGDGR